MKNPKLASRYAQALFDFAETHSKIEEIYTDILLINNVLKDNIELKKVIESPHIPLTKKSDIFHAIFNAKIDELSINFLQLIIKKRRVPELHIILDEFIQIYYRFNNIKVAQITLPTSINDSITNEICAILAKEFHCKIIMKVTIDPNIIGGIIIKVDDILIDASILSKIKKLRTEFSQNQYK
ncbi:MAG: ATP synthase F1 subunit delta, partial [Bacteroidetes bacterium HGW-Bacteroidetes-20]